MQTLATLNRSVKLVAGDTAVRSLVMWAFILAWGGMLVWAVVTYGPSWGIGIPKDIPMPADIVKNVFGM